MSTSTPNRATSPAGSPGTFAGLPEGLAQQVQDFVRKPGRVAINPVSCELHADRLRSRAGVTNDGAPEWI